MATAEKFNLDNFLGKLVYITLTDRFIIGELVNYDDCFLFLQNKEGEVHALAISAIIGLRLATEKGER